MSTKETSQKHWAMSEQHTTVNRGERSDEVEETDPRPSQRQVIICHKVTGPDAMVLVSFNIEF